MLGNLYTFGTPYVFQYRGISLLFHIIPHVVGANKHIRPSEEYSPFTHLPIYINGVYNRTDEAKFKNSAGG